MFWSSNCEYPLGYNLKCHHLFYGSSWFSHQLQSDMGWPQLYFVFALKDLESHLKCCFSSLYSWVVFCHEHSRKTRTLYIPLHHSLSHNPSFSYPQRRTLWCSHSRPTHLSCLQGSHQVQFPSALVSKCIFPPAAFWRSFNHSDIHTYILYWCSLSGLLSTVNVVSGCKDSLEWSLLANAFRSASNRSVQCKFSGLVYMGVIIRLNIKNMWWCSCTLFSTRCVRMDLVTIGFHAQTGKLNPRGWHNNNWGK